MHAKLPTLLALIAASPFLLAFSPPQEAGTHVSVSGGGGRFVSGSGCAHPRLVEHGGVQAGVYHHWKPKRAGWTPEPGLGLDVDGFFSREKECVQADCVNADPGWKDNSPMLAFSPYVTLDWEWVGAAFKSHIPLQGMEPFKLDSDIRKDWVPIPFGGSARLGRRSLYASVEVLDAQPIEFGRGFFMGAGGTLMGSELWAGLSGFESGPEVGARFGRSFGPLGLRLAGQYSRSSEHFRRTDPDGGGVTEEFRVELPQYAVSAGLDWRLPWW